MKWWSKISNIGLENKNDIQHVRHIHILNRILFLSCFFIGIYIPINIFLGNYFFSAVQSFFFLLIIIAYWFNYKKWFRFSTYYVFFFIILNITFAMVIHNNTGTEYLMIPSSFAPFVIFKLKRDSLIVLTVFMLSCILGLILQHYIKPLIVYNEKTRLILYFINVIISFIISGAIIMNFKKVIESYENKLLNQKQKIESYNKEIKDSINYAKRIQQARLPEKQEIFDLLPHSFILFKPKDIVSGDFYFFHKSNPKSHAELASPSQKIEIADSAYRTGRQVNNDDIIFIAAADCTGHGVPGAFMSLIISEKLLEASYQTSNVSEILKNVNNEIKKTLRQSDGRESTKDGMDIAFCSLDIPNKIINFSGAHRPIWIIKKGSSKVEEIKATKKAIGGYTENNQFFDSHELKLQKDDTFYIFTDGYADQFNDKTGKKLMTKKFKEILLNIQDKTMQEQEEYLKSFIKEWKGNLEQTDDILVIGIRLS